MRVVVRETKEEDEEAALIGGVARPNDECPNEGNVLGLCTDEDAFRGCTKELHDVPVHTMQAACARLRLRRAIRWIPIGDHLLVPELRLPTRFPFIAAPAVRCHPLSALVSRSAPLQGSGR